MAKTIDEGFKKLRSNLEITDLQEETVSERQKNVRKALEDDFDILESYLAGSYRRNTMIAPLKSADVDIFMVLSSRYYEANGQRFDFGSTETSSFGCQGKESLPRLGMANVGPLKVLEIEGLGEAEDEGPGFRARPPLNIGKLPRHRVHSPIMQPTMQAKGQRLSMRTSRGVPFGRPDRARDMPI